jgi:fucose 4-O-acetylase-like acetyltransferase
MAEILVTPAENTCGDTGSTRILLLDALRGLAIFLVVFGHAVQDNLPDPDSSLIFRLIYSFHIPLFIAISGYLAWKHINNKDISYLKKKCVTLVVPFLSWYCAGYAIRGIASWISTGTFSDTPGFFEYLLSLVIRPDAGLWFLWILFLCFVVLFIALKCEKQLGDYAIAGAIFLLFSLYFLPVQNYHLGLLQWYFPFFSLAYLAAKYQDTVQPWEGPATILAVLAFPVLMLFWHFSAPPSGLPELLAYFSLPTTGFLPLVITWAFKYLTAFSGIMIAIALIRMFRPLPPITALLSWLGKYTMDIYVSFLVFLGFLITGLTWLHVDSLPVKIVVCTILSPVLSLGLSFLVLRKSTLLSLLFLGKVPRQ